MSGANDDFIQRLFEILESRAAPAPTPAGDGSPARTHDALGLPRLALPLTVDILQAIWAETPQDMEHWRDHLPPIPPRRLDGKPWTAEQLATIDVLRQIQAETPAYLEEWRARKGLPSRYSTVGSVGRGRDESLARPDSLCPGIPPFPPSRSRRATSQAVRTSGPAGRD